jgi:hypothetical protein
MSGNGYVVYRILNTITGKSYVGISHNAKRRKKNHFERLKAGIHHSSKLQNSFNKHGELAFQFEILEQDIPVELSLDRERYWIKTLNSYRNGYNMTEGGQGVQGIVCAWNGIEYLSISDAADANDVNCSTMSQRLKAGYTCDADIVPKRRSSFVWNNIEYPTAKAAAEACGISVAAMRARIDRGYTADTDMHSEWASFFKPRSVKLKAKIKQG